MKKKTGKTHLIILSAITAVSVGAINTASALVAYSSFMPKHTANETTEFISDTPYESAVYASSAGAVATEQAPAVAATQTAVQPSTRNTAQIKVGSQAQPTSITTAADGKVQYRWCSGVNPNLEDGVCEAIISIAASPTVDNPHLSARAKQSLSLMPAVKSLAMDESSWKSISPSSGSMLVTADTELYGKVKLKVTLNKIDGIWIVTDGQLA